MNIKLASVIILGVCVLGGLLNWQVVENQKLTNENEHLSSQLSEQIDINKDYQARITRLNQLDIKYTQELASAKNEINTLRDAVNTGSKRVYVKAECPAVTENPTESGSNETSARFNKAVEQDYLRLREMIVENEQQTLYLQSYINIECQSKQCVHK